MLPDRVLSVLLAALVLLVLVCGLDDLIVDIFFFYNRLRRSAFSWPPDSALEEAQEKRIAIFVPLWHEHQVIAKMLDHNASAIRYEHYDWFIGLYPNDEQTLAAVHEAAHGHFNIHIAVCPHNGPTSKADCLNWIYQRMLVEEERQRIHFDIIMTHDAEDLIHPDSLRWINYFSRNYGMVQVPVLPLPTAPREFTHGVYCDEFAEFQIKDIPVRQALGGFIPSNGVGTGYARTVLEKLAAANANRIFEPACLTEDHENGYRIHRLNCTQLFIPIRELDGGPMATREYFPRNFRAAIKQRTRWTMGISLQFWERHGWRAPRNQLYWFWRDRKGLIGNLLAPAANLLFVYGLLGLLLNRPSALAVAQSPALGWLYVCTLSLSVVQLGIRAWCVSSLYGWRFAAGVPLRAIWGNWLNCIAAVLAIKKYFRAKLHDEPLVWLKTDHVYPSRAALMRHKRPLGEILVAWRYFSSPELQQILRSKPPGERLGDYLLRQRKLTEEELYSALSVQQNIPLGNLRTLSRAATRALPARVSRKWKVLPFKVAAGKMFVAGPELPSDEMQSELQKFSALEIAFELITPALFEKLAREYLP